MSKYIYSRGEVVACSKKEVGIPMGPGSWKGKVSYKNLVEVHMTCGGGMGGSSYHYLVNVESLNDIVSAEGMIVVPALQKDGTFKDVLINTKYVVDAEMFTLATVGFTNHNAYHEQGDFTVGILLEADHRIKLVSEYDKETSNSIIFGAPKHV